MNNFVVFLAYRKSIGWMKDLLGKRRNNLIFMSPDDDLSGYNYGIYIDHAVLEGNSREKTGWYV